MEKNTIEKRIVEFVKENAGSKGLNPGQIKNNIGYSNEDWERIKKDYNSKNLVEIFKTIDSLEIRQDNSGSSKVYYKEAEVKVEETEDTVVNPDEVVANPFNLRIRKILNSLSEGLIEKEEAMNYAFLASVAGESIFFLGLPGTAKSLVCRRLTKVFKTENGDIKYFEHLMHQYSTPEEIFGPVKLDSLKSSTYERNIDGYLPTADIVFLDEIWKANPAIQNTLLTIINEKLYHNGSQTIKVPLKGLVAASNELPAKDLGLDALWDRFIFRVLVESIEDDENFKEMITAEKNILDKCNIEEKDKISKSELEQWEQDIETIIIDEKILDVIVSIRKELSEKNIYVSDRRWKKIVHILKTSAYLNGHKKVDLMDLSLCEYCIWNDISHREECKEIVKNCIQQEGIKNESNHEMYNEQFDSLIDEYKTTFFNGKQLQDKFNSDIKYKEYTKKEIIDKFTSLKNEVEEEKEQIEKELETNEVPFDENNFANPEVKEWILGEFYSTQTELEGIISKIDNQIEEIRKI